MPHARAWYPGRAVAILFEHYYQELMNFCARVTRNRDAAADVVQETYVRVLAANQPGRPVNSPRALLYRTARNLLIDGHRRDAVRGRQHGADVMDVLPEVDTLAGPSCHEPETAAMAAQAAQSLLDGIQALPPRCRQAFVLHRFDGLSHAQVARQMGISVKMVEQHIKLAMQACRQARLAHEQAANGAGRITGTRPGDLS